MLSQLSFPLSFVAQEIQDRRVEFFLKQESALSHLKTTKLTRLFAFIKYYLFTERVRNLDVHFWTLVQL